MLMPWECNHLGELTADTCQVLPAPRCYLNHACAPNATSSSDTVRAWQAIQAGEEITIDQRLNALDDWEMRCACQPSSADLQRRYCRMRRRSCNKNTSGDTARLGMARRARAGSKSGPRAGKAWGGDHRPCPSCEVPRCHALAK